MASSTTALVAESRSLCAKRVPWADAQERMKRGSLKPGEDGFRLYLLHEGRCNPPPGGQLWLSFVTEDDLDWSIVNGGVFDLQPRPPDTLHRFDQKGQLFTRSTESRKAA